VIELLELFRARSKKLERKRSRYLIPVKLLISFKNQSLVSKIMCNYFEADLVFLLSISDPFVDYFLVKSPDPADPNRRDFTFLGKLTYSY
jgi:hypothetical protein